MQGSLAFIPPKSDKLKERGPLRPAQLMTSSPPPPPLPVFPQRFLSFPLAGEGSGGICLIVAIRYSLIPRRKCSASAAKKDRKQEQLHVHVLRLGSHEPIQRDVLSGPVSEHC